MYILNATVASDSTSVHAKFSVAVIRLMMYQVTNVTPTRMLITIAVILIILWFLGVIGVYTIGWFIHILLVAAIILFLIRVIQGENPLK